MTGANASHQLEILRRMDRARHYNEWLFARAEPHLGRRVLDAGAGIGTFTELAAAGRQVVALEPDPWFAERLRARFAGRANVEVHSGDVDGLTGAGGFDSILCFNVLEHIPDDAGALRRFHAALAPGGRLLLLVPAHPALFGAVDKVVEHQRRYRRQALRTLLESVGFHVADARYVNPLGAAGWLVSSRILRRELLPERSLLLYDRLVPALRVLDRLGLPFGLSVWAVARRP